MIEDAPQTLFGDRLRAWLQRLKETLAKRWWFWILMFLLKVVEDRFFGGLNAWLDKNAPAIGQGIRTMSGWSPGGIIFGIFLLVIFTLIVHAYFESRKELARKRHHTTLEATPADRRNTERATTETADQKAPLRYPQEERLVWKRFSDNDLNEHERNRATGTTRHTWIRIKKQAGGVSCSGAFRIVFPNEIDFLTNVPMEQRHEQFVSIPERRADPAVLKSIGQTTLDLYNKGAAIQESFEHCSDAKKAALLRQEAEEWFDEIRNVFKKDDNQLTNASARLILGNDEGTIKEKLQRRTSQLLKLIQGTPRFKNCQKAAITLASGDALRPGEEVFSASFTHAEKDNLLSAGAIQAC